MSGNYLSVNPFVSDTDSSGEQSNSADTTGKQSSTGAQTTLLWPGDFNRYIWASSVVVQNCLYIDGGELYTDDYVNGVTFGSTLAIDLTRSFSSSNAPAIAVDKPTHFPFSRQPWIWNEGNYKINSLGGWAYSNNVGWYSQANDYANLTTTQQDLWELDLSTIPPSAPDSGTWINSTSQTPSEISIGAGYLTASSSTTAFALGGADVDDPSDDNIASGFTGMAAQNLATGQWQNVSSINPLYGAGGFGAFGQAVYVPSYGRQGILVFLGGYAPTQQQFTWSYDSPDSMQSLGRINMYDIASQQFFVQPATGSTPGPRWGFCAVAAQDVSGAGVDIFMYGGYYGSQSPVDFRAGYDSVWVLSLPSFQWTQVSGSEQTMRALHTCEVVGESQMIAIGGDDPTSAGYGDTTDPWDNAIGVFDMAALNWTHQYNASASPYVRASVLQAAVGYAVILSWTWEHKLTFTYRNNQYPINGASLMGASIFIQNSSSTTTNDTPKSNIGAIAGGVVGGVLGLCAIAVLLWFFVMRPRRRRNKQSPSMEELGKAELDGSPSLLSSKHGFAISEREHASQLEGDEPTRTELDSERKASELDSTQLPRSPRQEEVYEMQGSMVSRGGSGATKD